MEVRDQLHACTALPPRKSPWHPLYRRLGDPRSGLDMTTKKKVLIRHRIELVANVNINIASYNNNII
jgi:hypothetical protein